MRWNGTDITGQLTFIYHDELIISGDDIITNRNGPGSLICSSETQTTVLWHFTDGRIFNAVDNFKQTAEPGPPSVSQLTQFIVSANVSLDPATNGMWYCSTTEGLRLHVAIYGRVAGQILV